MTSTATCLIAAGLAAAFSAQTGASPKHRQIVITRVYSGLDGQTDAEEIGAKFTGDKANDVFKLMAISGAELHRSAPGTVEDWHNAPRRQYVITLSGEGEVELAGGKKIPLGTGSIELAEDLTGKGHITRTIGNEDRITLVLPLADQSARSTDAKR